jgi:hypothetical protein
VTYSLHDSVGVPVLEKCGRCNRVYSTTVRDDAPADPDRCPECRIPLAAVQTISEAVPDVSACPTPHLGWRLAGVFAGLLLVIVGAVFWDAKYPGRSFDRAAWHADKGRRAMSERFVAHGTLIGKTREEVLEMLGNPMGDSDRNLTYLIGFDHMAFEPEWLEVMISPDGRVIRTKIWEH